MCIINSGRERFPRIGNAFFIIASSSWFCDFFGMAHDRRRTHACRQALLDNVVANRKS
jgi:hypothetical protein